MTGILTDLLIGGQFVAWSILLAAISFILGFIFAILIVNIEYWEDIDE